MDIKVKIVKGDWGKTKAMASITLADCFVVTGLKVIEGQKGLFVSMPNRKDEKTGEYKDTCFPITADFRTKIIDAVLNEYNGKTETEDTNSDYPF